MTSVLGSLVPTTWGVLSLFTLFGGLGLFLWGLEQLSTGMKKVAGEGLRLVLGRLTRTRISATIVGIVLTMVLQSSSATTVILVSLVQSGLLPAARSVGVIMGANVGTTFTGQLIAFRVTDYSLAMLAVGIAARTVLKRGRGREFATVLVGAGLMFFGLAIMTESMQPLRAAPEFRDWIAGAENLAVGLLVGAVFTAVVHSSAATMGVVIGLTSQGLMTLGGAIPILLGANLGTCITAVLASLKASPDAKRVAVIHILFNIGGIAIFAAWVPQFADIVHHVSAWLAGDEAGGGIARQVANAHTLFNVVATIVFLPFSGAMMWIARFLIRDRKEERTFPPLERRLLDSFAAAPALALVRSRQALRLLGTAVAGEILALDRTFTKGEKADETRLRNRFEQCRDYAGQIAAYQAELVRLPLSESQAKDASGQAMILGNLEPITRILERDALPLALEASDRKARFSDAGREELRQFANECSHALQESISAVVTWSEARATRALATKVALRRRMADAQRAHIGRVREGRPESVATDRIHMEILDLHRLILTYAGRIAEVVLEK